MMRGAGGAAVVFALLEAAGVLVRGHSARAEVRTVVDQVVRVDASEAETWALAAEVLRAEGHRLSAQDRDRAYRALLQGWQARRDRTDAMSDHLDTY